MTAFVKPVLIAGLCVGCLALSGSAQQPAPPAPPAPPPSFEPAVAPVPGLPGVPGVRVLPTGSPAARADVLRLAGTAGNDRVVYTYGFGPSDGEALKLARQIAEARSDTDKESLRDKMTDVLDKAFEERQKRHEQEIAALEAQVKRIKEMVAKRKENKQAIIGERVKQLEREAAGLGW